ncbi:MAG: FAD-binding protein [Parachlamydia sp.]|nr:MAG: FAD-binding protein [Parachlamydia sp.]
MALAFKTLQQHQQDVKRIQDRFKLLQNSDSSHLKSLDRSSNKSHMMRGSSVYRKWRNELGLDVLNSVIEIDPHGMKVIVEPQVPMDELTRLTLQERVVVPVVPEFKGITVGGAINGTAIESSSFRYGLFHDVCLAYHLLLGDGSILRVTPDDHPELFHGVSGSFGSLGILLLVELKVIPALPFVKLIYHPCASISEGLNKIKELYQTINPPEFIEGIMYAKNALTIIEGRWLVEADDLPQLNLSAPWSPWYYAHVRQASLEKKPMREKMSTYDYIFRHDTGAFWMAAYGLHFELLARYYLEGRLGLSEWSQKLFGPLQIEKFASLKDPGILTRTFLNWKLPSRKLYQMLHADTEKWFEERFIIQDYFIPLRNTQKFVDWVTDFVGIFPLWLCPVKATSCPQILAPHSGNDSLYVDIGVYGLPQNAQPLLKINREIDQKMDLLQGRKMLYSYCSYTEEEFWKVYPKISYSQLRSRYFANDVWASIEKKVL